MIDQPTARQRAGDLSLEDLNKIALKMRITAAATFDGSLITGPGRSHGSYLRKYVGSTLYRNNASVEVDVSSYCTSALNNGSFDMKMLRT